MQIFYERTGGFMGRTITLEVELSDLPPHQAETLRLLLSESDFFNLTDSPAQTTHPDEFTYDITVTAETQENTIHTSDTTAPEGLRPLLEELAQLARTLR